MAIGPINVGRVSLGMRTDFLSESIRLTQLDLFREQSRIATGRQFVTPSDDPVAATRAMDLTQSLRRSEQFSRNLTHADELLAAADAAMVEVNDLLIQANTLASQNVSNLTSAEERSAVAELVAGIRQQLVTVGNRQLNGRYIFAGRATTVPPFVDALNGIAYIGDTQELVTAVNEDLVVPLAVPGDVLFGALSGRIASSVDLSPSLTTGTALTDLNGASGAGIRRGVLVFNEEGGAGVFQVNLANANTIGDVVDLINQAAAGAGSNLTASLGTRGIVIDPGNSAVSVHDISTGLVASDLGILTTTATTATITGRDLGPRLTRLTPVSALAGGDGLDLDSGLVLSNGGQTVTVDISDAETVQDVLNRINTAGVFASARINNAGTSIDVFNQVSGTSLSIGENGGTTARDLGIRTLDRATPVERLNDGRGITLDPDAADLRITARNGDTLDVDLSTATTIGDVIDLINAAAEEAGVSVSADLASTGNGLVVSDATTGDGATSVTSANLSTAAQDLGLFDVQAAPDSDEVVGRDVSPARPEGVLTALVDLEAALRADDTQALADAGTRLDTLVNDVTRVHGVMGARSQSMRQKLDSLQTATSSAEVLLSEVQDLDYAEAATRLQSAVTRFQATLQAGSTTLNLSLLDFLQ